MLGLQQQIAKAQAESKNAANKAGKGKSKYLKRGQLEQESKESKHVSVKRQRTDDGDAAVESTSGAGDLDDLKGKAGGSHMSDQQIVKELRQRREPIRLFGESDDDRLRRLRLLQILQPDIDDGLRNEFMDAMNKVDDEFLESAIKGESHEKTEEEKAKLTLIPDWNEVTRLATGLSKGDDARDRQILQDFLKYLLDLWEAKLYQMPIEKKRSRVGRLENAKHAQARTDMKPLFRGLRKNTMEYSLVKFLAEIVEYMSQREYVKACDAYLRMAIGKSEWPIGVTRVGIHERSAREKIFSQKVAHVLNDETKRKYIQSLKRLITVMQRMFPSDPSKSLEYDENAVKW